jgi:1-hydroxycarotenoid 3,4-desaturase
MQGRHHKILIVGGGVAGLASALELAVAGLNVTVLERAPVIGGKLHQVFVGEVGIDSGPTVFTMRWVFEDLFAKAGTTLEQELTIEQQHILARHAWSEHERLDLYANREQSAQAIKEFAGAGEADRFLKFCDLASTAYRTLEKAYIRSQRPSMASMHADIGLRGMKVLFDLGLFQSLWNSLSRHFKDPRLHQLFSRYATYCGSSPLHAPATLMLIADVEMQGVHVVKGGMSELAKAIARLAQKNGAAIRTNSHVDKILVKNNRACGVALANGEIIEADSVIFNGDVNALRSGAVGIAELSSGAKELGNHKAGDTGPGKVAPSQYARKAFGPGQDDLSKRSLSALTLSMHAQTSGFPLVHHNLFFNTDYASEFNDVFAKHRLPRKPTVYLCAQDRRDSGLGSSAQDRAQHPAQSTALGSEAQSLTERLLVLINAPATGDRHTFTEAEISECTQASFALMKRCGLTIDHNPANTRISTPTQWHQRFPATGGALYGHATHGWMSAFGRHSSASAIPGLYLAGGSVHPGPGVPMATLSGRLAAETLMAHLGLTKMSRRVVISGGMSTH